jgi:SAM-dependent methyltransferase
MEERTIGGLHAFLVPEVAPLPRSTAVLDLGCGSGAWLARLGAMGFSDLSGVDDGAAPALAGIRFQQADLDAGRLDLGRKFHLITLIEVIEHLANPGNALAIVSAHLHREGRALLTSPNIHALTARVRFALTGNLASFDAKGDATHVTPLVLHGFQRLAAREGLAIERTWTYPDRGSLIFGRGIRAAAGALRAFVRDPLPGDTLCIQLRHAKPARSRSSDA